MFFWFLPIVLAFFSDNEFDPDVDPIISSRGGGQEGEGFGI